MTKIILVLLCLTLAACSVSTEPPPAELHPCLNHSAAEFVFGQVACRPESDVCAFDAHNRPTALDGSGAPLARECPCNSAGVYACFGAPSFATPDAL